jgi:tetratricopeptide (TPR) repeat protein
VKFSTPAAVFSLVLALAPSAILSTPAQTQAPQPQATGEIDGVVRDASGKSIANATVSLMELGAAKPLATIVTRDGTFSFLELHAGSFTINAENAETHSAITLKLELSASERKHIELILAPKNPAPPATNGAATPASAANKMEFSDPPNFTVAGMTDWSNLGLHGSDATTRTSETLARETAALKSDSAHESPANTGGDAATSYRLAGDRSERSGDPVAAVREYEQAARLDPSEENYFAWGSELLLHRATQPAAEVFSKGSALHPTSARILAGLGASLYANGLYDQAARKLCDAADLNSADTSPYLFLGKMAEAAAVPLPCAEEKLARFARTQPENPQANYYYAISIWKSARQSEDSAEVRRSEASREAALREKELLEKAIALNPGFAEAYLQLGILYFAQGDFAKATQLLQQSVAINPQLGEAHSRLGQAYKRAGEDAEAKQEFAIYKQCEKTEAETLARQRQELRQFLVILGNSPTPH